MIDESQRERLIALLDGELAAPERVTLEAELAVDLELTEEYEAFAALDRTLEHALAPLAASDDAIAAAVLARTKTIPLRPGASVIPRRTWIGVIGLAAALLLAVRLLPLPPSGTAPWVVTSDEGSGLWVPDGRMGKIKVTLESELAGSGEFSTLSDRPAALRDPLGAEVFVAANSSLEIDGAGSKLLGGHVWVRGKRALPIEIGGASVEGNGSFSIEGRDRFVIIRSLEGGGVVRFEDGEVLELAGGMAVTLGGKMRREPYSDPHAIVELAWAIDAIPLPALSGGALEELVVGHLASLEDDDAGPLALKSIVGILGQAALPVVRDALLAPTKQPGSPARQRLALALRGVLSSRKLADGQVEPLFELPLRIERQLLEPVLEALAMATGVDPVPDRKFWFGKISPEEKEKALAEWRKQWFEARARD